MCKITFGAEPKNNDVYRYLLEHWRELRISPPVRYGGRPTAAPNPRRTRRAARKRLTQTGVGTKAQQALKLQHEERKQGRKIKSREQRGAEQRRQYELKREKRKDKHRGR